MIEFTFDQLTGIEPVDMTTLSELEQDKLEFQTKTMATVNKALPESVQLAICDLFWSEYSFLSDEEFEPSIESLHEAFYLTTLEDVSKEYQTEFQSYEDLCNHLIDEDYGFDDLTNGFLAGRYAF
jgi:hypothetical protein